MDKLLRQLLTDAIHLFNDILTEIETCMIGKKWYMIHVYPSKDR